MAHRTPATIRNAPTLSELLRIIKADRETPAPARKRMFNAVRCFIRYSDVDPMTTKADLLHCRAALLRIEHVAAGITRAHVLNIRCYLRMAFAQYAGGYARPRKPLGPAWASLYAKLPVAEARMRLVRFIRWCDASGLSPHQVNDKVSRRYFDHLMTETTVLHPKSTHRRVCLTWNRVAATVARWPPVRLTVPCYIARVALPIDTFPRSFGADVERWKRYLASPPPLGPLKPLHSATVRNMVGRTMRFASILVREGVPQRKITSLSDLTRLDRFRLGMEYYWREAGKKPTKTQHEIARTMAAIAKYWVGVDAGRLSVMRAKVRQLRPPTQLSERNKGVIRQFDDAVHAKRLIALPRTLEIKAENLAAKGAYRSAARLMLRAVAVEILLIAPIRVKNLAELQFGTHFRTYFRDGRRTVYLVIPSDEVKNNMPLEFELPTETVALISSYLTNYRRHLVKAPTPMLFPGGADGHRGRCGLSTQITKTVKRYTGLQAYPHAFRHIAAKLHLMHRPNDYVPISLMLGHKSVETTRMYYCQLEMRSAARRYAEEVLGKRFAIP